LSLSSDEFAPIPAAALPAFRRLLLAWYRRQKRDLDWRRTRNPYAIWISEIMLQQTRVAAVIPYYRRFLERFPTVRHLARARSDVVLRHWAGLGYYSRARNLHRAAKEIVARHGGAFPRRIGDALALPGVGAYTAAAVLSIAYDQPLAVLDGNVARVLARLGAVRGDVRQPRIWRSLWASADALLSSGAASDWNQAMMELGAMICTPQAPRCHECPVSRWCRAHALGIAEELPSARAKSKTQRLTLAAAVLLDPQGHTLLVRQKDHAAALFSRMWQFPAIQARKGLEADLAEHLAQHLACFFGPFMDCAASKMVPLDDAHHTVTFRKIRLAPFLLRVKRLPNIEGARTPLLAQLEQLPVSAATRKIAAAALRALKADRTAPLSI
jgi:A/G-specific adenine glycosylase